jgi:hypothetical protein
VRFDWNPFRALWTPVLVAAVLIALALLTPLHFVAYPAGALLFIVGPRVAYNHRGVGARLLAARRRISLFAEFEDRVAPDPWYRQQMLGFGFVFLGVVALIVGSGRT